jgi:nucleoside-diphosphate-sugar epimerase
MPRALILGGTGLIGRATARRLLASGWEVDLTGRQPGHMPGDLRDAGVGFLAVDRNDTGQLMTALGAGADLLVDCICYTAEDATRLLPLLEGVGSTVMLSSKAVYVDAEGRHSNSPTAPCFAGPIGESQPTMRPSNSDYQSREGYGANKVAAELVLLESGHPVSVLRPSKVHGVGAARPREWVFVKRVLDQRPVLLLAHRGAGVDHPTAAANVASLIEVAAAVPGQRILNIADPDSPSGLEISRTIAAQLGHVWEEVLLDDDADETLGRHPWERPHPVILDTSAALSLGYTPAGDYATTVADEVDWLVSISEKGPSAELPPDVDGEYFTSMFDYGAEDRYLYANARRSPQSVDAEPRP